MPEFRTNKNGKVYPLTPKKGSGAAAAVIAGLLIAGAAAVDANGGSASAVPGSCQASGGGAKSEAQAGHRRTAWQKLCWRELSAQAEPGASCATASYGQVQAFFSNHPCVGVQRLTVVLAAGAGETIAVSISWVQMRNPGTARELKDLLTRNGTGSITPRTAGSAGHPEARFDGTYFHAEPQGAQVTVAEAAAAGGHPSAEVLRLAKDVAVLLPKP